jgi:hypothetical protein
MYSAAHKLLLPYRGRVCRSCCSRRLIRRPGRSHSPPDHHFPGPCILHLLKRLFGWRPQIERLLESKHQLIWTANRNNGPERSRSPESQQNRRQAPEPAHDASPTWRVRESQYRDMFSSAKRDNSGTTGCDGRRGGGDPSFHQSNEVMRREVESRGTNMSASPQSSPKSSLGASVLRAAHPSYSCSVLSTAPYSVCRP